jgi:hypothetical protein
VDDRRDLRAALQRASVRRFGGLKRERGGEDPGSTAATLS